MLGQMRDAHPVGRHVERSGLTRSKYDCAYLGTTTGLRTDSVDRETRHLNYTLPARVDILMARVLSQVGVWSVFNFCGYRFPLCPRTFMRHGVTF